MKLAAVYFDDTVCIPGGKDVGGGARRQDLRESTFHVDDGWEISLHDEPGGARFCIWREGMSRSAWVGGYGYTFVTAPERISVERVQPWDAVGGMMREMDETGDGARVNAIADKLEAQGETPMSATRKAIDAVLGPESPPKPPKKARRK